MFHLLALSCQNKTIATFVTEDTSTKSTMVAPHHYTKLHLALHTLGDLHRKVKNITYHEHIVQKNQSFD